MPKGVQRAASSGQVSSRIAQVTGANKGIGLETARQLMLSRGLAGDGIAVNSMSPGWVRTDMGDANAPRSVEHGADTAVWLASGAPQELTGKFFEDRKAIPW